MVRCADLNRLTLKFATTRASRQIYHVYSFVIDKHSANSQGNYLQPNNPTSSPCPPFSQFSTPQAPQPQTTCRLHHLPLPGPLLPQQRQPHPAQRVLRHCQLTQPGRQTAAVAQLTEATGLAMGSLECLGWSWVLALEIFARQLCQ